MPMEITNRIDSYYSTGINATQGSDQTEKRTVEKEKSSKDKVQDYYESLCKKFPGISFNTSGGELRCSSNKVVVNLSYDCLKKMANDPEFAKKVEWNLSGEVAANSQVYSFAKRDGVELGGRTVTYDADGNRQSSCGGMRTANSVNNGQSKPSKSQSIEERLRKKRKEKEEAEARIEEKRREKQEFEERMEKMRSEREAYLDRFSNVSGNLGSYQSADLAQTVSFFDENA